MIYAEILQDMENRSSKQYWLACQNLIQSIIHGNKGGLDYAQRQKALEPEVTFSLDERVKLELRAFS